jgi:hypothetical protein
MKYLDHRERKLKVGSTFISRPIQKAIGWLDFWRGYFISRPKGEEIERLARPPGEELNPANSNCFP